MSTFDTPEPIAVTVEAVCVNITLIASDRADTVVDVRPTNADDESDVRTAAATRVDYTNGRLLVKAPRRRGLFNNKSESIDVRIELPTGSGLDADVTVGGFTAEGRLGECEFKTTTGGISLEETGPVRLNSTLGRIAVERVEGRADITAGTGEVRLGEVDGPTVVKSLNGDTRIGTVTGDLRVKSANGSVRLNDVVRGTLDLEATVGDLEIGIREGTAAWLDVNSVSGRVRNSMTESDKPDTGDTAQVNARAVVGDVVVRRA